MAEELKRLMEPKLAGLGLKILYVLIPGIIALGIVKSLGPRRPRSDFESGLQIFVYGVISYAIAGLCFGTYLWLTTSPPVANAFWSVVTERSLILASTKADTDVAGVPVVLATLVSIFVGCTVAKLQTHSLPHRLLRAIGLTKRTSEVDIWELTLNSPDIDSWATVRHHANAKVYQGWVRGYSDGGDERELLLADVYVYASSTESPEGLVEADRVPVLYLGLDRKNATIELVTVKREVPAGPGRFTTTMSIGRSPTDG
jgi:Family of unknown function (DUF6338)